MNNDHSAFFVCVCLPPGEPRAALEDDARAELFFRRLDDLSRQNFGTKRHGPSHRVAPVDCAVPT